MTSSISSEKYLTTHIDPTSPSPSPFLSLLPALRLYRPAILWTLTMSLATIMESYALMLMNSFFAYPAFLAKFGNLQADGSHELTAPWQVGLGLSLTVGLIPGVLANGVLVERFGFRKVFLACHVAVVGFIFVIFYAPNATVLLVGTLLLALPCGVFAAATPSYAADVCPSVLRGYLTTYVNLCWVIGHILGAGILTACLRIDGDWSFKIPYALQWMWSPFLIVACIFVPESPWWHVRCGRPQEAEKALQRLLIPTAESEGLRRAELIEAMTKTIKTEREMGVGGSYVDCFKGTNLRRTEIAVVSWGCQILPGWAIQNYTTYFFRMAGVASSDSFKLTLGNFSIAFIGTVSSWFLQKNLGRRTIYLSGLLGMLPVMFTIGFLDLGNGSSNIRWAQASLLLVWFFIYGLTIGPIPYAIVSEVGAARLRTHTISLGRNGYYLLAIVNTVVAPYMLNPTKGNLKGKAAFPAAGLTAILLLWAYFRLPETKGLSAMDLDQLFHRRVSARKFKAEGRLLQMGASGDKIV